MLECRSGQRQHGPEKAPHPLDGSDPRQRLALRLLLRPDTGRRQKRRGVGLQIARILTAWLVRSSASRRRHAIKAGQAPDGPEISSWLCPFLGTRDVVSREVVNPASFPFFVLSFPFSSLLRRQDRSLSSSFASKPRDGFLVPFPTLASPGVSWVSTGISRVDGS